MNKILGEQKFQMSGCVVQECKVEAGQILGVGKIVFGSVGLVGKTYYLTLQLIDVKTGKVDLSAADKCKCELDELIDSTTKLAKRLLGEKVDDSAEVAAKARAEAEERAKTEQAAKEKAEKEAEARARAAGPEQKITNSIGMSFVYIKPGTFMMGSPLYEAGRDNDETQHQVTLSRGFYMQNTEVTQGQWQAVMGNNPSNFKNCGNDCSVESVSWNDVQEFIRRLNQKEGGSSYRLLTEAEWEYAARSGGRQEKYAGTDDDRNIGDYAWYYDNSNKTTHSVGHKQPNELGLYDMSGNVWEWCQDWYGDYPTSSVTDHTGPYSGSLRVDRGGGWGSVARRCHSAGRGGSTPDSRDDILGFRLSRTP